MERKTSSLILWRVFARKDELSAPSIHLKLRIADGTIFFRRKGRNPWARASALPILARGACVGLEECDRPATPFLSLSLSLPSPFSLTFRLPHSSQCPRLCTHVCRAWGRSPLATRFWRGPLPRGGEKIGARCCRCYISLGRRCRRRYACGGARRCHIDRALVTGERTNFSLLSPPFPQHITLFSLCLSSAITLSLSLLFYYISSFHLARLVSCIPMLEKKPPPCIGSSSSRKWCNVKREAPRWCTWLTQHYRLRFTRNAYNDQARPMPDYGGRAHRFDARPAAAAAAAAVAATAVRCASATTSQSRPWEGWTARERDSTRARFLSDSLPRSRSLISPACPWCCLLEVGTRTRSDRRRNRYVVADTPDNRVGEITTRRGTIRQACEHAARCAFNLKLDGAWCSFYDIYIFVLKFLRLVALTWYNDITSSKNSSLHLNKDSYWENLFSFFGRLFLYRERWYSFVRWSRDDDILCSLPFILKIPGKNAITARDEARRRSF